MKAILRASLQKLVKFGDQTLEGTGFYKEKHSRKKNFLAKEKLFYIFLACRGLKEKVSGRKIGSPGEIGQISFCDLGQEKVRTEQRVCGARNA